MFNVFNLIHALLGLVALGVVLAEDASGPGTGAEKKAKVVADVQQQLPAVAADLGVPAVLVGVLTNGAVLGILIDAAVEGAKKVGLLVPPAPAQG